MLLGKDDINTIEVLISKALLNSYINCDEFVSVNNVLKEHTYMKEEIRKVLRPLWKTLYEYGWYKQKNV